MGTQEALTTGFDGEISPRKPSNLLLVDQGEFYGEYMMGEPRTMGSSLFDGTFTGKCMVGNDMTLNINNKSFMTRNTCESRPIEGSCDPSFNFSIAAEMNAYHAQEKESEVTFDSQCQAQLLKHDEQPEEQEGSTRNSSIPMDTKPLHALRQNVQKQVNEKKATKALTRTNSKSSSESSEMGTRAKPTHPFRGRSVMQHDEFQSWSVKKIQMLAVEMEAMEDK